MDVIIIKEGIHFIGKPCIRCGSCVRYVGGSKDCVPCTKERDKKKYQKNREEKLEYQKDYYLNNKEYISEYKRNYRKNNKELLSAKQKKRYEDNKEYILGVNRRYRENNREAVLERKKRDYQDNKEARIEGMKRWQKNNPEKTKANHQRRRARKRNAEGSFTDQEWIDLCNQYDNKCLSCGEQKPLEADHIVPLSKGGSNWITNIQPLCGTCNRSKSTKTIDYRETFNIQGEITTI